jgi:hypothetical protein
MSPKYRVGLVGVLTFVALLAFAAVASARQVAPVTNLHTASGDATQVKIAWDKPAFASKTSATIDEYLVRRDGHQIADLQGFNGLVDTSYIDGAPSSNKAVYSVVAVDSVGQRSPPTTVNVPAPQAAQPPPPGDKTVNDGIQSSDLCSSIVPPDIRGNNFPTGLEKYGCGKGMNSVNDSGPGSILGIVSTPRPVHDIIQNFFIQFPITVGQTAFLANSAFSAMVMQAGTYMGIGHLFSGILQAFHGNPNYSGLVHLAFALSILFLTLTVIKGDRRKGYISFSVIAVALAVLTVLFANPFRTMNFAVNKPLGIFNGINSTMADMTAGTGVDNQLNLTVHPTYAGNKNNAAIRRAENVDWLMFQYVQECAINFRDYNWAMYTPYPGSRTSFCEKFVQVWGSGSNDDKNAFKDKLKAANKSVADFFGGKDQMARLLYTDVSKTVLMVHVLMKFFRNIAVFACMGLLLVELLLSGVWLIYALTGSDKSQVTAERRIYTAIHWFKLPLVILLLMLVQQVVEANIISKTTGSGFIWLNVFLLIWDLVMMYATYKALKSLSHEHKEAMERLGHYRSESRGLLGRAAGLAGTAIAGGFGGLAAEKYRERNSNKEESEGDTAVPADSTFDFTGFNGFTDSPPMLERGSDGGYGQSTGGNDNGPSGVYDAEGQAEELVPYPQLETVAASTANRNGSERIEPQVDVHTDVIVDADVVIDHDGSYTTHDDHGADTDVSSDSQRFSGENFRSDG